MLPAPFHNALVLTGPTGSGKSDLALNLAPRLNAEIISMDSMALYRRMDIGTAKPTLAQRASVPHHLIDVREPWESASVAWWLHEARRAAVEIESRRKQVLLVGGTPLYLKALISGLFDGPPADENIRRRLLEEAQSVGSAKLHERLAAIDPVCAQRLHPNDVRRMVRALEVYELTGRAMSEWQTQWAAGRRQRAAGSEQDVKVDSVTGSSLPPAILWLNLSREDLYAQINRRVEAMFAAGLVEEARQLRALDRPLSVEARQAVGYKEVIEMLDGRITTKEAITRIQTRSRQFAKRQLAWFRHLPSCQPVTRELTRTLWQPRMKA